MQLHMLYNMVAISWTCEHEWWASECEQLNPKELFKDYFVYVNIIFSHTWDKIFSDVKEYYAMCSWLNFFMNFGNIFFLNNWTKK
jgi:hypothetical protein